MIAAAYGGRMKLRRQVAEMKQKEERRWHDEFQAHIMILKLRAEIHGDELPEEVKVTAKQVMTEVAAQFGYTPSQIKRKDRHRPFIIAKRTVIAAVYVQCPHMSLVQIGRLMGGLDHTSILHHVVKAGVHTSQRGTKPFPIKMALERAA